MQLLTNPHREKYALSRNLSSIESSIYQGKWAFWMNFLHSTGWTALSSFLGHLEVRKQKQICIIDIFVQLFKYQKIPRIFDRGFTYLTTNRAIFKLIPQLPQENDSDCRYGENCSKCTLSQYLEHITEIIWRSLASWGPFSFFLHQRGSQFPLEGQLANPLDRWTRWM